MTEREGRGREALENEVYELIDPDGMGWASGDAPSIREVIEAILKSDWLKVHDAEVAATALRDAADDFYPGPSAGLGGGSGFVRDYLRARADEGNPR